MTLRDLTALTIRISGLVLFVLVIARLPEYLKSYIADTDNTGVITFWIYFLPLTIPGLVSLLLFTFPYSIVNKIITPPVNQKEFTSDLVEIESILIRLLGLLLLYFSLSDLTFHLTNFYHYKIEFGESFSIEAYNYSYLFATAAEFVFAFWLLAGTKSVIKFTKKLRRQ